MLHTYANYVKNLKAMSTIILNHFIGHAAYYAWARAKQFCCHSVCLSVIMGSHFQVIKHEHCSALQLLVFLHWWENLFSIVLWYKKSRKLEEPLFLVMSLTLHCKRLIKGLKIYLYIRTFSRILFSQTNNCAPRTIFFLSFHTFFIVHRSILTVKNLMKVKAQQSFKKFYW